MLASHWDKMLKIINLQGGKVPLLKETLLHHWLALFLWGHGREDHWVETVAGEAAHPLVSREQRQKGGDLCAPS